jgi:methyl-accepting chemotaxis protein
MKHFSLQKKLWLVCGSLLALLLLVGGIGYMSARTTAKLVHTVQFNVQKQQLTSAIQLAVEKQKVGGRDVLLHGDTAYLNNARAELQRQMDTLQPLLSSTTSHELFQQIQDSNAAYDRLVDQAIQLRQSGDSAKALELFYGPIAHQTREELSNHTADLVAWYSKLADEAEAAEVADTQRASLMILGFSLLGLLFGAVLAASIVRSLIGSIQPIVAVMKEISNHNLSMPDVEILAQDELGEAGKALNAMKANLTAMVRSITQSAELLAAATEQIAQGARQSSASAHSEAEQACQAASAMQEMSATVHEVAGHAQAASDASVKSAQAARQGGKVAEETLATMNSIATSTSHAAACIVELGKSSEKIGNIVAVITEIAGQTNLLALNAAIEAARAGEQGRGFAVVAGEVRRLAERTATATQEIASMIQTIQSETQVAVEAIEKGNRDVELGVQKTGESGEALTQIIGMSEQVGNMVAQIATAASQQQGATEQINSSVSQISDLTQKASINADETANACVNLSSLANDLHKLVNKFKVDDERVASGFKMTRKRAA